MANIILPQAKVLDTISNSATMLVEENGEIKRYNVTSLINNKIKANARNLLDNSDFRNPVNQRGGAPYTANGYTIDRWKVYNGMLNVVSGKFITLRGAVYQLISGLDLDKTYTFAAETAEGIVCISGTFRTGASASLGNLKIAMTTGTQTGGGGDPLAEVVLYNNDGYDVGGAFWAALYEGEYTAETLPEYQPKGYGAELAECLRYFQKFNARLRNVYGGDGSTICYPYMFGIPMRIVPTVTNVSSPDGAEIGLDSLTENGFSVYVENTAWKDGNILAFFCADL